MRQKARYVLASRERNKTQRDSAEKMLALIDELSGEVMRAVYNRASLATHIHQSKGEVQKIKRYVDTVLFDLLGDRAVKEPPISPHAYGREDGGRELDRLSELHRWVRSSTS